MIGLYGVIAYSTSQRTSEIGVRIAIGAQRSDVIRMVLVEGARLAIVGIVLGLAGSYWAARLLSSFLYGVTTTDLPAFAGAAVALFIVALVATYLPARKSRARRSDDGPSCGVSRALARRDGAARCLSAFSLNEPTRALDRE